MVKEKISEFLNFHQATSVTLLSQPLASTSDRLTIVFDLSGLGPYFNGTKACMLRARPAAVAARFTAPIPRKLQP